MKKTIVFKTWEDVPPMSVSLASMEWNSTGSWRHIRPLYEEHRPPCTAACPAGERIPQYFAFVSQNKLKEAWHVILEDNPLPGICGRVCPHFCEQGCNRRHFDQAIAVHCMERFVADSNFKARPDLPTLEGKKTQKAAVIGSGPAGLSCAWQLARRGYGVTIFERLPEAGGMLRAGIPPYRLPRAVLDKEIGDIQSAGVEIVLNRELGKDLTWDDLSRYQAVLLATGDYVSKRLAISGEDLEGVQSGLHFLMNLNMGRAPCIGKRVIVIGGGNTAMDAARCALRLRSEVTVVYRRSRTEMPAFPDEIIQAEEEGIHFQYLTQPVRILNENGKAGGLECRRQALGDGDGQGRRKPIPIEGSEFEIPADTILVAIGEESDTSFLPEKIALLGGKGEIGPMGRTRLDRIFAGGDLAMDKAGTVVSAVRSGKLAALGIHEILSGVSPSRNSLRVVEYEDIRTVYFAKGERPSPTLARVNVRLSGFSEIEGAPAPDEIAREAKRCFSCGVCTHCDNCMIFCPDSAVSSNGTGYSIDYEHCKGCGVCVQECPRNAMAMEREHA
ncbi:MAG: FAD-dependent oxidoreductase [Armatimonadetes bacterium]|nr:FAD-dependent oxidoreductase [Armatimonadota bacterium]